MLKRIATAVLICTVAITGAACSSNADKKETAGTASPSAQSVAPTESPEMSQAKAYIAPRMAEEKVDLLFNKAKSKDKKPILNPIVADKAAAAKFLNAYIDPALTEKILSFYLTSEKADDAIVVKETPFFSASILKTASKADVTFEGSPNEYKMTTKDGGVFTVKKNAEGNYILADYAKK